MKKVLVAALVCAVSSFATWDYFPIKDAGKGEVKAGVGYLINAEGNDKVNVFGIEAGARFSVIQGLEVAVFTQFPMSQSSNGDSCEENETLSIICPPSMTQPAIGLRYWLPMGLGIALDITLPFQGDFFGGNDAASLGFRPALQYSTNLTPELSLGSEVGLDIGLENGNKKTPGMELGIGVELDYSLGMVTPFVGADLALGLTKPKTDVAGTEVEGDAAKMGIDIGLGAIFAINDTFGADVSAIFGLGERYEKMPITIAAHFSLNF
jgi:opacity protein-like surface antigen